MRLAVCRSGAGRRARHWGFLSGARAGDTVYCVTRGWLYSGSLLRSPLTAGTAARPTVKEDLKAFRQNVDLEASNGSCRLHRA